MYVINDGVQLHSPGNDCGCDISFKILNISIILHLVENTCYFLNQRLCCSNNLLKY